MIVKLNAKKVDGGILISENSFEHLLSCLDNQKYVGELPCCGDGLDMPKSEYESVQAENQAAIDNFNRQCRELLHGKQKGGE